MQIKCNDYCLKKSLLLLLDLSQRNSVDWRIVCHSHFINSKSPEGRQFFVLYFELLISGELSNFEYYEAIGGNFIFNLSCFIFCRGEVLATQFRFYRCLLL